MLRKVTLLAAALLLVGGPALANTKVREPEPVAFSFEGPFGRYDQTQLQRGFKVYREVCSACHSMNLVAFRNLGDPGGPFFNPEYSAAKGLTSNDNPVVKALAADTQIADLDSETGDAVQRPGIPADRFPAPFPNVIAAKASNGGLAPPDLSLMAKAREGGPEYIASLLQGYGPPAHGVTLSPGQYYNAYFVGGVIGMAPPLAADKVSFDDGTKSTVRQQAEDVAAFLMWTADPHMEARKQMGFSVLIFLVLFSGLLYASYRRVWRNESH
jgi:ubiquinol-cytochrome c reductase cytochrome c1 subunit